MQKILHLLLISVHALMVINSLFAIMYSIFLGFFFFFFSDLMYLQVLYVLGVMEL